MKHTITMKPANTILRCLPSEMKIYVHKGLAVLVTVPSILQATQCLSTHNWKNKSYAYPTQKNNTQHKKR